MSDINVTIADAQPIDITVESICSNLQGMQLEHNFTADHQYSGIISTGVAGCTTTFGQLLYLSNADDRWELAKADAEATSADVLLGINITDATSVDGSAISLLLYGFVRDDNRYEFASGGDALYIDASTGGEITATLPSANVLRIAGYAHDDADVIFFNPSATWISWLT